MEAAVRIPPYPKSPHSSGRARIRLNGKDVYLGVWNTPASRAAYDRTIAEWLSLGQQLLPKAKVGRCVRDILTGYIHFVRTYYVKDGKVTAQIYRITQALERVERLYGDTPVESFGPKALKAVRQSWIADGWSRGYINSCMGCVKRAFKWAASEELIAGDIHRNLETVENIHEGRSASPEPEPIIPVEDWVVEATLPHCPRIIAAMIRLQALTGARPGEICSMRRGELSLNPSEVMTLKGGLRVRAIVIDEILVGLYAPRSHKTQHRRKSRVIALGPAALDVLAPFLDRPADAYLFSPREARAERFAARRAARQTPVQPSQVSRAKANPQRRPRDHYTNDLYRQVIQHAVSRANRAGGVPVPYWFPLQLRHGAATKINDEYDLHYVAAVLGHAKPDTSRIYAEQAILKAAEVMARAG